MFEEILHRNEQAVAELRSMARTLGHSIDGVIEWEPQFRDRWLALLDRGGRGDRRPRRRARVAQVRADLTHLAEDMSTEHLSGLHWPEYGALIMNLRNVVTSMDRVAEQNPVVLPRYARRDRLLQTRARGSGDDHLVLGQRDDATVADREAAPPVLLDVDPDHHPVGDDHVLVQDRVADDRARGRS